MKYFKDSEFARPDLLRPQMKKFLDDLREAFGQPLVVSSSYRDPAKNVAVGGVSDSAHMVSPTDGLYSGVDLTTLRNKLTSAELYKLVTIAFNCGILRMGLYSNHVHFDMETRLPQRVLWLSND